MDKLFGASSFSVGMIRGIRIEIDVSLLVIVGMFTLFMGWQAIPAAIILFGSVLLHELGHSFVAQHHGIPVRMINLNMLGGVAMLSMPVDNKKEFIIAAAGPIVSAALCGIGALLCLIPFPAIVALGVLFFAQINGILFIFNLIPAFPMDGGRMLRAALTRYMSRYKATRWCAYIAYLWAAAFIICGLAWGSFMLPLIGVGVVYMASREKKMEQYRFTR